MKKYYHYYDRQGKPYKGEDACISWAKDFELLNKTKGRIIKQQTLWNGLWVSTVWLGLNHNWSPGEPAIFETMVFLPHSLHEIYCQRYATEKEAQAGHLEAVKRHQQIASMSWTFSWLKEQFLYFINLIEIKLFPQKS